MSESGNSHFYNFIHKYIYMYRNFDELKNEVATIDKPKFEAKGDYLGAVDIKLNHMGNRLAVTSLDYALSVYNIQETSLTHIRDLKKFD